MQIKFQSVQLDFCTNSTVDCDLKVLSIQVKVESFGSSVDIKIWYDSPP